MGGTAGNANICMIFQIKSEECCFCVLLQMPPHLLVPVSRDGVIMFRKLNIRFAKNHYSFNSKLNVKARLSKVDAIFSTIFPGKKL